LVGPPRGPSSRDLVNVIGRFDHAERRRLFATTSAKPEASAELVRLRRCDLAHERRGSIGVGSPQGQYLDLAPRPVDQDLDLGAGDQARRSESQTFALGRVDDLKDALGQLPCNRDRLGRVVLAVRRVRLIRRVLGPDPNVGDR
jgi:hypothetical protein